MASFMTEESVRWSKDEKVQTKDGEFGWDVCNGSQKDGLKRLTMVPPALTRAVTNVAGWAALGAGYAVGKVGENVRDKKAVDSKSFHLGLRSFLWSNGIFPRMSFETSEASLAELSRLYKMPPRHLRDESIAHTPLVVANHICYLDGTILATCFKSPKIVAMAGTRKIPVIGKLMEEMDTIFVDRSDADSRNATQEAIKAHCNEWQPGQRPMLIFPEGTTTNGEGILEFKKGAFVPGVPVRPVVIVYTGQWDPASTTYRVDSDGLKENSDAEWALQFFGHFVHSLHIRVLAPYVPNDAERADPDLYARNCQSHMASELRRVRQELFEASWKKAAGRTKGGLGYKFGDVTRVACQHVRDSCRDMLKPKFD